jgi:lambda repressor-like predicted transcriptional regulator
MPKTELGDFLQAAAEKQFGSAAKLSRECGLSQNTVGNIILQGRGLPDALVKIARTLKMSPVTLFVKAGWTTEEEVRQHNADGELTLEEHRLLDAYRGSSKDGQVMLLTMSQEVKEKLAAKRVRTK